MLEQMSYEFLNLQKEVNILAINTDSEANMVTKAGYAVIADLHEVIPAITEEIRRRRG